MKAFLLFFLFTAATALAEVREIHINPDPGNDGSYLGSSLSAYFAADADGFPLPQKQITLAQLPQELLPQVGALIGALKSEAESGTFKIIQIVIERLPDDVSYDEQGEEISRTPVFALALTERDDERQTSRTRVIRSSAMAPGAGSVIAAVWAALLQL